MGLKFSNINVPTGATVTSASVELYCTSQPYSDAAYATSKYAIFRITQAWDGATRWNKGLLDAERTEPVTLDPTPLQTKVISKALARTWFSFDVTNAVKSFVAGSATNNGFLIRELNRPDGNGLCSEFASMEATDATKSPKLVIVYTGGIPNGVSQSRAVTKSRGISITSNDAAILLSGFSGNLSDVSVTLFDMQGKNIMSTRSDNAGTIRLMPQGASGFRVLMASVKVGKTGESVQYRVVVK